MTHTEYIRRIAITNV